MHSSRPVVALVVSGAILAALLAALTLALEAGSSEAQSGIMHNCPAPGKWSIAVWDGESGTAAADALVTCGTGTVDAAYALDAQTGGWWRWFAGNTSASNMAPLNDMQGVLALRAAPVATPTPSATPTPALTPVAATTYVGTTTTGARVEIKVNTYRTEVTRYEFGPCTNLCGSTYVVHSPCGWYVTYSAWHKPVPITNDTFSHTTAGTDCSPSPCEHETTVTGTFSGNEVTGTIAEVVPGSPECNTGEVSWTAWAP